MPGENTDSANRQRPGTWARNDRFSVGGNSPVMAEEYREYSRAQLQEMLSLDAEQMEQVTPEMTVREIRELKRPKEIPYYEIPGQLTMGEVSLEDFLGAAEEPATVKDPETPDCPECSSSESHTIRPEDFFPASQPGECIHRPGFACTLPEGAKQSPGTGADCSTHCCWDCVKHGDCRLECMHPRDAREELRCRNGSWKRSSRSLLRKRSRKRRGAAKTAAEDYQHMVLRPGYIRQTV